MSTENYVNDIRDITSIDALVEVIIGDYSVRFLMDRRVWDGNEFELSKQVSKLIARREHLDKKIPTVDEFEEHFYKARKEDLLNYIKYKT